MIPNVNDLDLAIYIYNPKENKERDARYTEIVASSIPRTHISTGIEEV